MKKVMYLLILGLLISGLAQAGTIIDDGFDLATHDTKICPGWTNAGGSWMAFRDYFGPEGAGDMALGENNNGNGGNLTSDAVTVSLVAGDVVDVSFWIKTNGTTFSGATLPSWVDYKAELILDATTTIDLGTQRLTASAVNPGAVAPTEGMYAAKHTLAAAVSSIQLKITINNSNVSPTTQNDQVYVDNVSVLSYKEYEIIEDGGSVTVSVALEEDPGVEFSYSVGATPLSGEPNDLLEITYTDELVFNSTNWTGVNLTVTSIDDDLVDGNKEYLIGLSDPNFAGLEPNQIPTVSATPSLLLVRVLDDDGGMNVLNADSLKVAEGGIGDVSDSATFQVQIYGTAIQNVVVDLEDIGDPDQVTLSTAQLVFTPTEIGNATSKDVTITAIDGDAMEEPIHGTTLTITPSSTDPMFSGLPAVSVDVEVLENDCGAVEFDPLDTNEDCKIDIIDLQAFVAKWLDCYLPNSTPGDCPDVL